MSSSYCYVIGGPLQPVLEASKLAGTQPLSDFNVFIKRNGARLATTSDVGGGTPTSTRRRISLASALAKRRPPDEIFIASGEDVGLPLALAMMMRGVSKPLWIIIHGSYLGTSKLAAVAPFLRRARNVGYLCLSKALQTQMIETYGFAEARCFNAGYGVDTSFFRAGDHAGEPLIVSAGSSNRDYRTLIAATDDLQVPVRIAADSLWRPNTVDLDDVHVSSSTQIASAGDYTALRALYQRALIVVVPLHPARFASGYAVIAEAMAMGKVVVTTWIEGRSDFIVAGENGLYTEAGDVQGLRDALLGLLQNPSRARMMGAAAAAHMQNFSLDAYCERIESLITGSISTSKH